MDSPRVTIQPGHAPPPPPPLEQERSRPRPAPVEVKARFSRMQVPASVKGNQQEPFLRNLLRDVRAIESQIESQLGPSRSGTTILARRVASVLGTEDLDPPPTVSQGSDDDDRSSVSSVQRRRQVDRRPAARNQQQPWLAMHGLIPLMMEP